MSSLKSEMEEFWDASGSITDYLSGWFITPQNFIHFYTGIKKLYTSEEGLDGNIALALASVSDFLLFMGPNVKIPNYLDVYKELRQRLKQAHVHLYNAFSEGLNENRELVKEKPRNQEIIEMIETDEKMQLGEDQIVIEYHQVGNFVAENGSHLAALLTPSTLHDFAFFFPERTSSSEIKIRMQGGLVLDGNRYVDVVDKNIQSIKNFDKQTAYRYLEKIKDAFDIKTVQK